MKNINKKIVISTKMYKIYFYLFLIFLLLTIYLINYSYKNINKDTSNIESLETVLTDDEYNTSAYLDVSAVPILIASVNNQNTGYYLVNSDKYMYIAYMNDEQFNKLKSDLNNGTTRIYGVTALPSDDFKKILVNDINTSYSYSYTVDDYDTLVGQYELDMIHYDSYNYYYFIYPVLTTLISLFFLFLYNNHKKIVHSTIDNISEKEWISINKEFIESSLKSGNTYLTDNYILRLGINFSINKLSDVILIYQRNGGLNWESDKELLIYTKQSKYVIRSLKGTDKEIELLAQKIIKHNKDVLIGYTDENIKELKEQRKLIK